MIIGRKQEQEMLNNAYNSDKGEFVIVYGRRRVGKTFLVRKVLAGQFDFHVTGLFRKNKKRQLENFANALSEYSGKDVVIPQDWYEAFRMLRQYLQTLGDKRKVVFIDEMPWMATAKSDFVGALETFWNGWGAGDDTLKLIVCGSASSWFTDNVFSNKGGLFNRDTMRIYLRPFTLHETEEYMQAQGIVMNRYEIIECYMIMGGIPYYLSKLNKGYSLAQNIDMMFFRPKALLFDEFEHLYDALFSKSTDYVRIVKVLAGKRNGLTQKEILEATGMRQSGAFSRMLDNLIFSDIVTRISSYGERHKEDRYLLTDFYTQFYFRFIRDNESKDSSYWVNRLDDPSHEAWRGLSFERVCMQHIDEIKLRLGILGVATETYAFEKRATQKQEKGTQIDMVIDRRDQVVNLCECKYSRKTFTIDKSYRSTLENKVETYKQFGNTRKAVHLAMITTYGLTPSAHNDIVQSTVAADDLFSPLPY